MSANLYKHRTPILTGLILIFVFAVALWPAPLGRRVRAQQSTEIIPNIPVIAPGSAYRQTNLMTDVPGLATTGPSTGHVSVWPSSTKSAASVSPTMSV